MMLTNEIVAGCGKTNRSRAVRMNELSAAIRSGDTEKVDSLYQLAREAAACVIRCDGTIPKSVGEEMVDETMLRLFESANTPEYVASWIRKVVTNQIIDYKRLKSTTSVESATIKKEALSDPADEGLEIFAVYSDDPVDTTSNAALRNCTREVVQSVLRLLPDQQRVVLMLSSLDMYTQEEIAARLGLSRSTVAAHLRAGKANFRREFCARYDIADFGFATTRKLTAA